jgi:endonuclease G
MLDVFLILEIISSNRKYLLVWFSFNQKLLVHFGRLYIGFCLGLFYYFMKLKKLFKYLPVLITLSLLSIVFTQTSFNKAILPVAGAEAAANRLVSVVSFSSDRVAPTISSGIGVSQVYGGGGNAGSTYKNDFIELFNRGTTAVSLNGWSVQYSSSTGVAWSVTNLTNVTLAPGQYYLVAEAAGAGGTTDLPAPDVNGAIAMSSSAGKVLVASTTAAATNADGSSLGANRIDILSYGTTTTPSEGTPTTNLSNTTAAIRNSNGCTDTDNNASDFGVTSTVLPRNTASLVAVCSTTGSTNPSGTGSANPSPVLAGNNTLLTVTVTPGTNPTSTGLSVSANLSAIGGSTEQTFFDDGINGGDVTAGDNIFSYNAAVSLATTAGTKSLAVAITDAQNRTGNTAISLSVTSNSTALAATGAADPNSVIPGNATLLTVSVTPATNPISTGLQVFGNLSPIGGSSSQQFFDDGTNGDATANDKIFSYSQIVAVNQTGGNRSLSVSVTDAQSRAASSSIILFINAPFDEKEHLTMGNPSNATADVNNPLNYLMVKRQYAESYNRDNGRPNWVSWHLDSTWLGSASRQDDFRPDPALPADWYHVTQFDYSGSGFDRGHLTPSGDRTSSVADNSATFLMTNMMPQAPDNNQGPWEQLESYCRTLVSQGNELYIVAGGVGIGGTGSNGGVTTTIAGGRVTVPAKTWKVIIILPNGSNDVDRVYKTTRTIAVIMPNAQGIRATPWQNFRVSIRQVERLTGYNFFSNVRAQVRRLIKTRTDMQ